MELKNKCVSFLGDSLTNGGYVELVSKKAELKNAYNYGEGGTRIAHQHSASIMPVYDLCFCGRAYNINPDSDIIVVFGGTNDYGSGDAAFGSEEDKTPDTFCGAVDFLMNLLKDLYKNSKIVFFTPIRRAGDERTSGNPKKAKDAKPLVEYAELIKRKGLKYNIPVLDLYNEFKVNPNIDYDRKKYTLDGLHLNGEGNELLSDVIVKFLESI